MDFTISWPLILNHIATLGVAYVISLPIAWDRDRAERSAGLRTFPIVAISTCGFMLLGLEILDSTEAESRVLQGLITGIGFIGGGAILKNKNSVRGTATAASLWNTGAIGIAVAVHRLEIAILLSLINFFTLHFLKKLKDDSSNEKT
ncbi:MAG: MgtC/SapB family protein [Gammaproteobacteria bacterium]